MGGGLMQLVAYGSQDVYLTGNPQITFFKVVYRRHTNFSIEPIQQVFNGIANWGHSVSATIARNGDLLYRMYITIKLPAVASNGSTQFRWLNWLYTSENPDIHNHILEMADINSLQDNHFSVIDIKKVTTVIVFISIN